MDGTDLSAVRLDSYRTQLGVVLQDTFLALLRRPEMPANPEHYCVRAFRNRALNYRRSLWRRLTRELESQRWFERSPGETPAERRMMQCIRLLPAELVTAPAANSSDSPGRTAGLCDGRCPILRE